MPRLMTHSLEMARVQASLPAHDVVSHLPTVATPPQIAPQGESYRVRLTVSFCSAAARLLAILNTSNETFLPYLA
jgi:hypothetical protein